MTGININLFWPIPKESPISQYFGENPGSYTAFNLAGHNGIDFAIPTGTSVMAASSGKVIKVGSEPSGYGNYVKLDHGPYQTLYAHLDKVYIRMGEGIMAGVIFAKSGNTGNSTGPHLHFELRVPGRGVPGYSDAIDPFPFLSGEKHSLEIPSSLYKPIQVGNTIQEILTTPIYMATVNVKKLYIRSQPSTALPSAGSLPYGITVAVYEIVYRDGNAWARVGKNLYIACIYKGDEYLIMQSTRSDNGVLEKL